MSTTGREALEEMRRLLGVPRVDADTPLAPQPGPEQLETLIEQVRGAGLARVSRTPQRRRRSARAPSRPSTGSCRTR